MYLLWTYYLIFIVYVTLFVHWALSSAEIFFVLGRYMISQGFWDESYGDNETDEGY